MVVDLFSWNSLCDRAAVLDPVKKSFIQISAWTVGGLLLFSPHLCVSHVDTSCPFSPWE